MSEFDQVVKRLTEFRDERDWNQFHNPKDLAIALNIEAGELLENFLWKDSEQADYSKVREELADVLNYAFLLADKCNFDIKQIMLDKIELNDAKYPVSKAKGNAKKYNEL